MDPERIHEQLSALRRLERRLRLVWGIACAFALVSVVLLVACFIDWQLDLQDETPPAVRWLMLLAQIGLWAAVGYLFLIRPLFKRLRDDDIALWVERKLPAFGQRLISAVQLNRPGADTRGMSNELIAAVTEEAKQYVLASQLLDLPDRRRLRWGLFLIVGTILIVAINWLILGAAFPVLVGRQFLADWAIPRRVTLRDLNARSIWPSGERVELGFFAVSDADLQGAEGYVHIEPEGRAAERYPLTILRPSIDSARPITWYCSAEIPPGTTPFRYQARLRDGRTDWREVTYTPRPTATNIEAWILLPEYVGLRPDGQRYAQPQQRGDIVGVAGSGVMVRIETNTRVAWGDLVQHKFGGLDSLDPFRLLQLDLPASPLARPGMLLSMVVSGHVIFVETRRLSLVDVGAMPDGKNSGAALVLDPDGRSATAQFTLEAGHVAYTIDLADEHRLKSLRPARRTITVVPDEPPQVVLLPERFAPHGEEGLAEDVEVDNMPLPLGEAVQIGYACRDPLGLDRAELRYRVNDGPWRRLALREAPFQEAKGPFDQRRGLFARSSEREQVPFHAMPSPAPELTPGRLEGGGRFDFQTRTIPGLKLGDTLEFFVEVYDRNPQPDRQPGRSEIRQKKVVTAQQFKEWVLQTLQHEKRLRTLEQKQRGVFDKKQPGR